MKLHFKTEFSGDLTVNGSRIAGFSGNTYTYNVVLPAGTTAIPTIGARTNDAYATAKITQASALPGTATVLVTAQDGVTTSLNTINFTVPIQTVSTTLNLQDIGSLPAVPEVPTITVKPRTAYTFTLSLINSILLGNDPLRKVSVTALKPRLPNSFILLDPVTCPPNWYEDRSNINGSREVGIINCVESDTSNRQYDITYGQTGVVSFTFTTPSSSGTTDLSLPVSYIKNDGLSQTTTWSPAVHIVVAP